MSLSKQCKQCKEIKPLEKFTKDKTMKDDCRNYCRLCERVRAAPTQRRYWLENKERLSKYSKVRTKLWRLKNKEEVKVKKKAYYEANIEIIKVKMKKYVEANKEKIRARQKIWVEENAERLKLYRHQRYMDNWGEIKRKQTIYRAKNKDKINERVKAYRNIPENKEHKKQIGKIYARKNIDSLADMYILQLLYKGQKYKDNKVPKELIEAKRMQLLIKREVKKLNKGEEL